MNELKRCTIGLGTFIEFTFPESAAPVYNKAVVLLRELEAELSFFNPHSDVSRFNDLNPGESAEFGPRFIFLLELCAQFNLLSGGIFDPRPEASREGEFTSGFLVERSRIEKLQPMIVDLGGIAKGYIVDRLVEFFEQQGVHQGLINAGGDLRCWGEAKRAVHLRLGLKAVSHKPIEVENSAVAGSGWEPYCSVKAESAVLADAFTKIYMRAPKVAEEVRGKLNARVELLSWLGS